MNFLKRCDYQIIQIQSNLSTKVNPGELQKWPLLTGGRGSGTYIYTVNAFEYVAVSA